MDTIVAEYCDALGYTVAGFAEDIYEDAYICIPPLITAEFHAKGVTCGRVLSCDRGGDHHDRNIIYFVLELEQTKVQVPIAYGKGYPIFFMLPEKVAALAL